MSRLIPTVKRHLITLIGMFNFSKPKFVCPICAYRGPFRSVSPPSGTRQYAQCPACKAMERHRLQYLALESLLRDLPCASMKLLHVAPEPFFRAYFQKHFGGYETTDLFMKGVDHRADLTNLPFADASYDMVFASHVLEHIRDDAKALAEIHRILRPGGLAVLPVPLLAEHTVEYPEPNPAEAHHVRAPGYADYFDRYKAIFNQVETIASSTLPEKYQLYVYEDRSHYPTFDCPWRLPMPGERHADVVPICYR